MYAAIEVAKMKRIWRLNTERAFKAGLLTGLLIGFATGAAFYLLGR